MAIASRVSRPKPDAGVNLSEITLNEQTIMQVRCRLFEPSRSLVDERSCPAILKRTSTTNAELCAFAGILYCAGQDRSSDPLVGCDVRFARSWTMIAEGRERLFGAGFGGGRSAEAEGVCL